MDVISVSFIFIGSHTYQKSYLGLSRYDFWYTLSTNQINTIIIQCGQIQSNIF